MINSAAFKGFAHGKDPHDRYIKPVPERYFLISNMRNVELIYECGTSEPHS